MSNTLNVPFARKVLEHLLAHPEEHHQSYFGVRSACGTAACVAGTACLMDPDTPVEWTIEGMMACDMVIDGRLTDVPSRAADLLGLDWGDANALFYSMNNASALEFLGKLIAEAEAR